MSRYIDADKINPMRCPQSIEEMRKWIDEQPTADVVEVVRCKYCVYRSTEPIRGWYRCHYHIGKPNIYELPDSGVFMMVKNDDFCSRGERKVQE